MSSTAEKRRRSPSQPVGCWIRADLRLAIYLRDDLRCAYCGRHLRDARPEEIALDHLLPRSAGGSNIPTNLVTSCRRCNCSRQDTPWIDFAPGGAVDRIRTLIARPVNRELARAILADKQAALVADLEAAR